MPPARDHAAPPATGTERVGGGRVRVTVGAAVTSAAVPHDLLCTRRLPSLQAAAFRAVAREPGKREEPRRFARRGRRQRQVCGGMDAAPARRAGATLRSGIVGRRQPAGRRFLRGDCGLRSGCMVSTGLHQA